MIIIIIIIYIYIFFSKLIIDKFVGPKFMSQYKCWQQDKTWCVHCCAEALDHSVGPRLCGPRLSFKYFWSKSTLKYLCVCVCVHV